MVYLPIPAVPPPLLLLLATKCPTPSERRAEARSVSVSGKDAPWACGLTDPALPAHLAPVLLTLCVFWTERNRKVRYKFSGKTAFGATWPDCGVCPRPGLTSPSPRCLRQPGRPALGGDLGQPVWGPGSGLGSGRPSVRPRSPDPGWRGHVLLLGMRTAPAGSLQPSGMAGTRSTPSQAQLRPPWPMASRTVGGGAGRGEPLPPLREQAWRCPGPGPDRRGPHWSLGTSAR